MSDFTPTKIWARRNLKAVEELIEKYQTNISGHCPLCEATKDKDGCDDCPWTVFTGGHCTDTGNYFRRDPIHKRLCRLYGWRIRLKNFIAGKTVWDKKMKKFRRAA